MSLDDGVSGVGCPKVRGESCVWKAVVVTCVLVDSGRDSIGVEIVITLWFVDGRLISDPSLSWLWLD
jgi:hypothetical protein